MFEYYDENTAPAASRPMMEQSKAGFGLLPNLHKVLAESPAAYQAYLATFDLIWNKSSLTKTEAQVVFMTANLHNSCHYCMAGHSWAMDMMGEPKELIAALRTGAPLADPKLRALQTYTNELLEKRGHIGDDRLKAFLDAGYTKAQALDVLCGLAAKLVSNFTNALAHTEIDAPWKAFAWKPGGA